MTIEEAIRELENARDTGVKSILLAYWEASAFGMNDDENWEATSEYLGHKMDWSHTHDDIQYHINNYQE